MSSICGGLGVRIWPITTTTVPTSDWRRRRPRGGRSTPDRHGRNSSLASGRRSAPSVHVVSSGLIILATTSGAMPWAINRGADCATSRRGQRKSPIANSPAVGIRPRKCRTGMHAGCDRTIRTRISVFDDPQSVAPPLVKALPHLPWLGWRNLPQVAPWAPAWRTASTPSHNPLVLFCTH